MQYRVYGASCLLSCKPIIPEFVDKGNGLSVGKPGRLLLQFVPRMNQQNRFDYYSKQSMALTMEEIGHVLANANAWQDTKILRQERGDNAEETKPYPIESYSKYSAIEDKNPPHIDKDLVASKILRMKPLQDDSHAVIFELEEVDIHSEPLRVEVQAGQFEVIKAILRKSVTALSGAGVLQKIDDSRSVAESSEISQVKTEHQYSSSTGLIPF